MLGRYSFAELPGCGFQQDKSYKSVIPVLGDGILAEVGICSFNLASSDNNPNVI